jgi:hypothetical protein
MKIGTVVRNEYQGILRFGKVSKIYPNHKGDNWTWCEVDWVDDEVYKNAIAHRNSITSLDHSRNIYRVDELNQFDLNKTIDTLSKLK